MITFAQFCYTTALNKVKLNRVFFIINYVKEFMYNIQIEEIFHSKMLFAQGINFF